MNWTFNSGIVTDITTRNSDTYIDITKKNNEKISNPDTTKKTEGEMSC